jgi:hypothetical protein
MVGRLLASRCLVPIMKKPIISLIALTAILCACPTLQSCSSTQTTYTTTSGSDEYPAETTTTTTTTDTTTDDHDSVVGSTLHAVGTIIAAPFRLVGDAVSIIL